MSTIERELTVALAHPGAFIGAIMAGPLSDTFGRKPIVKFQSFLFATGSFIMAFSQSIHVLMAGRIVAGLGIGIAS